MNSSNESTRSRGNVANEAGKQQASQSQAVTMDSHDTDELNPQETLLLLCGFAAILASAAPWIVF